MSDDNDLPRALGRLEGKIDLIIDMHKETATRLGAVEKRSWMTSGTVSVIMAFLVHTFLPK